MTFLRCFLHFSIAENDLYEDDTDAEDHLYSNKSDAADEEGLQRL